MPLMRITTIGGGPGGLFASILLKKARPDLEVEVFERNGPGDTFGWGVVFSDETLEGIKAADPESLAEIASRFTHWTGIDVHFKGQVIRSGVTASPASRGSRCCRSSRPGPKRSA